MSKKRSRRRRAEEDDFISHQSWPFRKRLRLPSRDPKILIQLCAAFNMSEELERGAIKCFGSIPPRCPLSGEAVR